MNFSAEEITNIERAIEILKITYENMHVVKGKGVAIVQDGRAKVYTV